MHPTLRKIILSTLLAAIAGAAFRLSFDAQVTLADASGIDHTLGWLYPGVVDLAIFTGVLISIWNPDMRKQLRNYLWGAIAFWTATSVLGNAIHVIALPPGRITVPIALAVAVNTIPALTLFVIIHLTTTTAFAVRTPTTATRTLPRSRPAASRSIEVEAIRPRRTDIPQPSIEELVAMSDSGMSYAAIGAEIGRGKSWVGDAIKTWRDEHEDNAELTA